MAGRMGDERSELRLALARYRPAFVAVIVLSTVVNFLLLGGSIFMMMVYDSVLPSHSVPTLLALLAMIAIVYAFQALFETMRGRLLADVAAGLDREVSPRIQHALLEARRHGARLNGDGLTLMRDFDQVRGFLAGQGFTTLIDLPWIAFFLAILFLLHPWLGLTALVGALVMLSLAVLTDRQTRDGVQRVSQISGYRNAFSETNLRHSEVLEALGMRGRMQARWEEVNAVYQYAQNQMGHVVRSYGGFSKVFRMFLQSLILSVGALLVIDGKASGGVIFASSILSGRALAPVDSAIANWRGFAAARLGWRRVNEVLARIPISSRPATQLPRPTRDLTVEQLVVAPPGTQRVTVQGVGFRLVAGDALGIVGPSAAGKTSLGRAIVGAWKPARGTVRLDGAALDQWEPDALGAFLGYLPQTVELLEGTIAENIARFDPAPASDAIIAAARAAGVHELIVQLPQGYETPVGVEGSELSAGQRQRIGLARALYGDPFLVLLDEPNSNLDPPGEAALEQAVAGVRERGGIAIVIAHRPSALSRVSHILLLRDGRIEAFGPREEMLKRLTAQAVQASGGTSQPQSAANQA